MRAAIFAIVLTACGYRYTPLSRADERQLIDMCERGWSMYAYDNTRRVFACRPSHNTYDAARKRREL